MKRQYHQGGYTLIEVSVVMGIIALLSVIGISALISGRASSTVDAVAQDLITTIRQAQNNAISVKDGGKCDTAINADATTKVWGVSIDSNDYTLDYYCNETAAGLKSGLGKHSSLPLTPYPQVTITPNDYVYFSAPFGRGYNVSPNPASSGSWYEKTTQELDWAFGSSPALAQKNIVLTGTNGYTRTIVIKANGDVYAQ